MDNKSVAVVIPVTRPDHLSLCLDHLVCQTYDHADFEIILVKRGELKLDIPATDIKIRQLVEERLHTGWRRNRAVDATGAGLLAFLDDDTIPPADWIAHAVGYLGRHRDVAGVCGPILHFREDLPLGYRLSGAANDSFFLEGFDDRKIRGKKTVQFYNMPLCNSVVRRRVWEDVGGFNEVVYYYMDDIEFFHRADRAGYRFEAIPGLGLRHAVEPFPFGYLRKKFITRFHAGINSIVFRDIYGRIPFVNLAFLAYPALILLALSGMHRGVMPAVLVLYAAVALFFSMSYFSKSKTVFIFLPAVFFLTHLVNFSAFSAGVLYGFWNLPRFLRTHRSHRKIALI